MNKGMATLAAGFLWALSASAASAEWREYVYADEGFAITLPTAPEFSTATVDAPAGQAQLHIYTCVSADPVAFVASVGRYPNQMDAAATLSGIADAQAADGWIVSETPVTLDGNMGGDFVIGFPDGRGQHGRVYVVGQTLYQVWALWPKDRYVPSDVERFLNSIRLVGK